MWSRSQAEDELLKQQTLLIIDDDAAMRTYLANVLATKDRLLLTAGNGEEGLSKALANKIDLILLDLKMPVLDGVSLCKALRKNSKTKGVPILVVTSSHSHEEIGASMVGGADDFISKPIDLPDMFLRIQALLQWKDIADPIERMQHYNQTLRELSTKLPPPPRLGG